MQTVGLVANVVYDAIPPIRHLVFVGWLVASLSVGWVLSHVLLAGVYYLADTPIGLLLVLTSTAAVPFIGTIS